MVLLVRSKCLALVLTGDLLISVIGFGSILVPEYRLGDAADVLPCKVRCLTGAELPLPIMLPRPLDLSFRVLASATDSLRPPAKMMALLFTLSR